MNAAKMPALVVLGPGAVPVARRLQQGYPGALLYGLRQRVADADQPYDSFSETLQNLYRRGTPIVAFCAAGIVIRSLAPVLQEKGEEPPVLVVAEDGSAVVPLLGGLAGVNSLAREIAGQLQVSAAITTAGELRFGTCLLSPPPGYVLADLEQGKRLVSDLLAGARLRVEGEAPWLQDYPLPLSAAGERLLRVTPQVAQADGALCIHPRVTLLVWQGKAPISPAQVAEKLRVAGLAAASLAALLCLGATSDQGALQATAEALGVALRFVDSLQALPAAHWQDADCGVYVAANPALAEAIGRPRGELCVLGLGPGGAGFMAPEVRRALDRAQDVLGYATYLDMAGPFRPDQAVHASDNREELQRAAHALELAATGRRVVLVSSGDPGVFAMAAAVLEALEASDNVRWHGVHLRILPGISAAMAAAALAGAPLGHDFCVMSLSDNLKPWAIIEARLRHSSAADLVLALYNPVSRARPWQLGVAIAVLREQRSLTTQVVLARDVGRPEERLLLTTLGELKPEQVDMRTVVLVGSSQTRRFAKMDGASWVYTPRSYPAT